MVQIILDGETFEAETLTEARKLARKAERAAMAKAETRRAARDMARVRAKAAGFHLYNVGLRPSGPPR